MLIIMRNSINVSFTRREIEIAELISEGFTEKEIADKLFISPATVNNHARNIRDKFGLRKNIEIVLLYISFLNKKDFSIEEIRKNGVKSIL